MATWGISTPFSANVPEYIAMLATGLKTVGERVQKYMSKKQKQQKCVKSVQKIVWKWAKNVQKEFSCKVHGKQNPMASIGIFTQSFLNTRDFAFLEKAELNIS